MKILPVAKFPSQALRLRSVEVKEKNEQLAELIEDLEATMLAEQGIGISAIQVFVPVRVFLIQLQKTGEVKVFINPTLQPLAQETEVSPEGCLSFPGIFADVKRFRKVRVTALDKDLHPFTVDLEGIDAICAQHELDHLNGITFYDHLSRLKKEMIRNKLSKLNKPLNNA